MSNPANIPPHFRSSRSPLNEPFPAQNRRSFGRRLWSVITTPLFAIWSFSTRLLSRITRVVTGIISRPFLSRRPSRHIEAEPRQQDQENFGLLDPNRLFEEEEMANVAAQVREPWGEWTETQVEMLHGQETTPTQREPHENPSGNESHRSSADSSE